MRIIPESWYELQIDLASSISLLPNFVLSQLGIASSFNFFDPLVFSSGGSLGVSLSCLFFAALSFYVLIF